MTAIISPYIFPERALARWTRENLQLQSRPDGGIEASFRFEGSTCGNIAFDLIYRVGLGPPSAGQRIEAMFCELAQHTEGHTRMCCWQENSEASIAVLRREAPLLGEALDAVLTWRPQRSPAGCLCAEPSRHHKWQAVLETIHFALHRPAQPTSVHENRNCS